MPPTFILSQDQTLQFGRCIKLGAKTQALRDQSMSQFEFEKPKHQQAPPQPKSRRVLQRLSQYSLVLANSRIEILEFKKISKRSLTELSKSKFFPPQPQHRNMSRQTTEPGRTTVPTSHRAVPHGWVRFAILPANYRLSTALAKTWNVPRPFSAVPRPSAGLRPSDWPIPHTLPRSHRVGGPGPGRPERSQPAAPCPEVPEGGSGRCRPSRHCRPARATRVGRRWKTDRSRDKLSSRPFPQMAVFSRWIDGLSRYPRGDDNLC